MSIDGTISAGFVANDRRTVGLNTGANIGINQSLSVAFTNGAGANQAQVLWQASRTFSGTTDTLDLFSGLNDSYGTAVVLTGVKGFMFSNTGTSLITIGNAASNPWNTFLTATGTMTLNPGDWVIAATPTAAGWAVGTSTNVNVLVTGTNGQTYAVAILGIGT